MPKIGYTTIPVKMRNFLEGTNPMAPEQELEFYDSAEKAFEHVQYTSSLGRDRLGYGTCIVKVPLEDSEIHLYPLHGEMPQNIPHVLGFATLQMDKVTEAAILWNVNGMGKQVYLAAGACDWEAARQEGWLVREEQFKQQCLTWDTKDGVSTFARHVISSYMDAFMDAQTQANVDDKTGFQLDGIVEKAAYDAAQYPFPTEMDRVMGMLSAMHATATKLAEEQGNTQLAENLHEKCADFSKFVATESQFRVNMMGNMRNVAAFHLAFLPEDMMHEATQLFNEQIWQTYRGKTAFTDNLGQYTYTALAVTLDKMSTRMDGELLAETAQHWKQCSDEAIQRGAAKEETCWNDDTHGDIPVNDEENKEEP